MKKLLSLSAAVLLLAGFLPVAGAIEPTKLQCEYRINPLGIDVTQPRLTWQVQSNQRNQGQSACQILLAGSRERFQKNQGEC